MIYPVAVSDQRIRHAAEIEYQQYYLPLMELRPHLLENYLMNYVFKINFPFGREKLPMGAEGPVPSAESAHAALCLHAALAQMLLIGMAGHYEEDFNTDHIVKLIQSLSKTLEHNPRSIQHAMEFAQARTLSNPLGMTILLRTDDRTGREYGHISPARYTEMTIDQFEVGPSPFIPLHPKDAALCDWPPLQRGQ